MAFVQPNPDGPEGEPMVALFELGARRAADAVRNGEQTAEALAEALLARCAASPLNAFITLEAEHLRAAARAADQRRQRGERLGPLHGVPLAFKDNIDTADFPTTGGTPALAAHRPKRNAPIVQRLLDAGAIVLGKTNLQELAYGPTNNNAAFGPARNPYDPTRIPGGSSGGSAAAVAARLAPAARIPVGPFASLPRFAGSRACGRPRCAGRKPGSFRSRIPVTPLDRWRGMLPTACCSTASLPAVLPKSRPLLSKACASGCRAAISGKISTPSSPRFLKQRWHDCARPVSCWSRAMSPMSPPSTPLPAFPSCSTRRSSSSSGTWPSMK